MRYILVKCFKALSNIFSFPTLNYAPTTNSVTAAPPF